MVLNGINIEQSMPNYAVFGNPIKHSKSPHIHALFARQAGITLKYQAIEVPLKKFGEYVGLFSSAGGLGLNITIPFKEEAWSFCSALTERAQSCGSVNTIWFDTQFKPHGDTTDGPGLMNDLIMNHQIDIKHKSVLILGAGGTVKAILGPLIQQQPSHIIIANRTVRRAEALADKFSASGNIAASPYSELSHQAFDLIINGTSLSLKGKFPAVPESIIKRHTCCYDLMYSNKQTVFMQWAAAQGAQRVLDGLGMLVEQAAESFFIWHGIKPDTRSVIKSLRK